MMFNMSLICPHYLTSCVVEGLAYGFYGIAISELPNSIPGRVNGETNFSMFSQVWAVDFHKTSAAVQVNVV